MQTYLTIPDPCHENWDAMTPEEQGRYCGKCCKVVVDFTSMPTEDVIRFISDRSSQKICGHFRTDQIGPQPEFKNESYSVTGRLKLFLAALVFVFGSALFTGCGNFRTMGEPAYSPPDNHQKSLLDSPVTESIIGDSIAVIEHPVMKGEVQCTVPKDSVKPPQKLMGKPVPRDYSPR